MLKTTHILIGIVIVLVIAGCSSMKLLDSNKEFVSLMQNSAEAKRLHDTGIIDPVAYESIKEELKAAFATNGDRAVKAAKEAKTDQSKASLYNVAVRSYLKSGGVRDQQILTTASNGIDACSRLKGLDALPTTCGYFHIVIPQAVSNEWQRKVDIIKRKQNNLANGERLVAEDGKILIAAARGYLAQLQALEDAKPKIDFASAGEHLETSFRTQQDILFCNSQSTLISLRLVISTGDDWNKEQEQGQARELMDSQKARLEQRPGGFPADTCMNL